MGGVGDRGSSSKYDFVICKKNFGNHIIRLILFSLYMIFLCPAEKWGG